MNYTVKKSEIEIVKKCNICGGKKFKRIGDVYYKNNFIFFQTSLCINCNYVFRSIRPKISWFLSKWKYRHEYQKANKVKFINNKIEEFRIERYNKIFNFFKKKKILGNEKSNFKIIDVGCGTGTGLRVHCKKYNIYGLEADSSRGLIAKKNGVKVFENIIENFKSKFLFNVVMCIQTLEHFHKPQKAIQQLSKLCRKNGYVYIEVPNVNHYVSSWHDIIYLAHMSSFSPENLKKILLKHNLTPIYETFPQMDNGEINLGILARKDFKDFKVKKISSKIKNTKMKKIIKLYSKKKNKKFFKFFPIQINTNIINDISLMVKPIPKIFKNVLKNIYIRDLIYNRALKKYEIKKSNLLSEKIPFQKTLKKMKYKQISNNIEII